MPHDIRIIQSRDIVRLDADGHFDMPATRRMFSDLMWACVNSHIGRVMADLRDATAEITTSQIAGLANVCREVSPAPEEHKLALLVRPEVQCHRASLVAVLAKDQGWNIEVFAEFEPCFDWLNK